MAKRTFCISEDQLKSMFALTGYADIPNFVDQVTDELKGQGWKCSTSDSHGGNMWSTQFDDGNTGDCPMATLAGIYEEFMPDLKKPKLGAGASDFKDLEQLMSDIIDDSTHIGVDVKSATVTWQNGEERSYEVDSSSDSDSGDS